MESKQRELPMLSLDDKYRVSYVQYAMFNNDANELGESGNLDQEGREENVTKYLILTFADDSGRDRRTFRFNNVLFNDDVNFNIRELKCCDILKLQWNDEDVNNGRAIAVRSRDHDGIYLWASCSQDITPYAGDVCDNSTTNNNTARSAA